MKNILTILTCLTFFTILHAEVLFEVKDDLDRTVMEVSEDGLRILNPEMPSDTLMAITKNQIIAFANAPLNREFDIADTGFRKEAKSKLFSVSTGLNPNADAINDSVMVWYKQQNAFRVNHVLIESPESVGQASFAAGRQSQAGGYAASAFGYESEADGYSSFAAGNKCFSSGSNSIALGFHSESSGSSSIAIGDNCTSSNFNTVAMGASTTASGQNAVALGSGTTASGNSSTAFGGGSTASAYYTIAGGYNSVASGIGSVALGYECEASGSRSFATGNNAVASEYYSYSIGNGTVASGQNSTAIGYNSQANAYYSIAIGENAITNKMYSTAIGYHTLTEGNYATAMGENTTADSRSSFVIGRYNLLGNYSVSEWYNSEPLFIVGNGSSDTERSNAFEVKKNGDTYIPSLVSNIASSYAYDLGIDSQGKLVAKNPGKKYVNTNTHKIEELEKENKELKERIAKLEEMMQKVLDK